MTTPHNTPNKAIRKARTPLFPKIPIQTYTITLKGTQLKGLGDITRDIQLCLEEFAFANNLGLSVNVQKLNQNGGKNGN